MRTSEGLQQPWFGPRVVGIPLQLCHASLGQVPSRQSRQPFAHLAVKMFSAELSVLQLSFFFALNFLQLEGQRFFQELALRHISPAA